MTRPVNVRPERGSPSTLRPGERRRVVLIAEDDEDIRESLVECLESSGYEVAAAADGQEAVESLRQGLEPDLVVLDLMMPRMDGWEVLKWLRIRF